MFITIGNIICTYEKQNTTPIGRFVSKKWVLYIGIKDKCGNNTEKCMYWIWNVYRVI